MAEVAAQIPPLPATLLRYSPNRACEYCRALKVRCIPADPSLSPNCERCFKAGKECVHIIRTRRKPRSRNDAKIMELEKELRALSSMVKNQHQQIRHGSLDSSVDQPQNVDQGVTTRSDTASLSPGPATNRLHQTVSNSSISILDTDIIGRDIVLKEAVQMYLARYINVLLPNHPFLVPDWFSLDEVRRSRPVLFLAMVAAGSSIFDPDTCRELYKELTTVLMEKIVLKGSKNLDVLQALLIAISYHYPPDGYDALKYVQYTHLAAGIVSELRVQRKEYAPESFNTNQHVDGSPMASGEEAASFVPSNNNALERERTLLVAYTICCRVCCSFHLPSAIPFTGWVQDCIDRLESSPNAIESDKLIIALVRQQRIMEESVSSLGIDDVSVRIDISVPRNHFVLKGCDRQLTAWKSNLTMTLLPAMEIIYNKNRVLLHEVSLYADHQPDDFRPPYTLKKLERSNDVRPDLTPGHADSTFVCLSAAQTALDIFLRTDLQSLQSYPDLIFTGVTYSVIILVKLYISVNETTSPFARLLDLQTLKLPYYIDNLIQRLGWAGAGGKCRMAARFATILENIRKWVVTHYGTLQLEYDLNEDNESESFFAVEPSTSPGQLLDADFSEKEASLEFPENFGSEHDFQDALQDFAYPFPSDEANLTNMDIDWEVDENALALFQEARAFNPSLLTDLSG